MIYANSTEKQLNFAIVQLVVVVTQTAYLRWPDHSAHHWVFAWELRIHFPTVWLSAAVTSLSSVLPNLYRTFQQTSYSKKSNGLIKLIPYKIIITVIKYYSKDHIWRKMERMVSRRWQLTLNIWGFIEENRGSWDGRWIEGSKKWFALSL